MRLKLSSIGAFFIAFALAAPARSQVPNNPQVSPSQIKIQYLQASNNLSDLGSIPSALTHLGIGALGTLTPGTNVATILAQPVNSNNGPMEAGGLGSVVCVNSIVESASGPGLGACPGAATSIQAGSGGTSIGGTSNSGGVLWDNGGIIYTSPAGAANDVMAWGGVGVAPIDTSIAYTNLNSSPGSVTAAHVATFTGTSKQTQDGGPLIGASFATTGTFNGATISAASYQMSGFGASGSAAWGLTPTKTGKVLVGFSGNMRLGNAAVYGCLWYIAYGTGTAPPVNNAATGTQMTGNGSQNSTVSQAGNFPANQDGLVLTLTKGTAYWFDVAVESTVASDTCQVQSAQFWALEQ